MLAVERLVVDSRYRLTGEMTPQGKLTISLHDKESGHEHFINDFEPEDLKEYEPYIVRVIKEMEVRLLDIILEKWEIGEKWITSINSFYSRASD